MIVGIIMKRKMIEAIRMINLRTMSIRKVMIQARDTNKMSMNKIKKKRRKKKGMMKVTRIMNLMKIFKGVKVFNRIKSK